MFRIFTTKKKKPRRSRTKSKLDLQEDFIYKQYRSQAESLLRIRTQELAEHYGFEYNRVSIKNTKTRWGSCSSKRNINLHYKLLFVEDFYRDYVIIHELCHLRQMNHSKLFWDEVEAIMPNYKKAAIYMRKKHPQHILPSEMIKSVPE